MQKYLIYGLKSRIVLVLVLTFFVLILAACNSESTTGESIGTTDGSATDTAENQSIDTTTLIDADMALTLEGYGAKGALADTDLSIADMLMYAIEDEYLAHGEYLAIMDEFGTIEPYDNIAQSEETHIAYLEEIYQIYGLVIPEDDSADHVVLVATLLEAAEIGVQAEIDNIAMYELFLTYPLPDDIVNVFIVLKNASEIHLQAFQTQVDKYN